MNASRWILAAANANTGWVDLRAITGDICYIVTGTFNAGVVSLQYSNNESFDKGTDFNTDPATITAAVGPQQIPFGVARFVRFIITNFQAGMTVNVSFAKAKANAADQLVDVIAQVNQSAGPFSTS